MKVVILAGGQGSRLSEYTKIIPKPMVKISGVPIISRIIKHYKKYGFKEYLIASGYKSKIENFLKKFTDLDIQVLNTGLNTMTGGRIKRLRRYIGENIFINLW